MEKIRFVYISMIFLLLFSVAYIFYTVLHISGQTDTGMHVETIKLEDMYIIKFDIFNNEDRRVNYVIHTDVGEDHYRDFVSVRGNYVFTYRHEVYSKNRDKVDMKITVYREGESEPWEQVSFPLVFQ